MSANDPERTSRIGRLSVDDLGGVLLRINYRDYDDRISFLNFSSGSYCRFFASERTFCLCVHSSAPQLVEPGPLAWLTHTDLAGLAVST